LLKVLNLSSPPSLAQDSFIVALDRAVNGMYNLHPILIGTLEMRTGDGGGIFDIRRNEAFCWRISFDSPPKTRSTDQEFPGV